MKKNKIEIPMSILSFFVSLLSYGGMLYIYQKQSFSEPIMKAAAAGAIFALPPLLSLTAMHISAHLRRSIKIKLPKLLSGMTILMLFLSFAAGFAGQLLYSLHREEIENKEEISSDIVIMLDDSGSMLSFADVVHAAAMTFVDGLSENCRAAAGIFAAKVDAFEGLTYMTPDGKQKIKDLISKNNFAGGTDFNEALNKAYDCLMGNNTQNTRKTVVLITDGQAEIDDSIKNKYLADNIQLYSVRISGSEGAFTNELIDFVTHTGGFDTAIDLSTNSDDAINHLAQAFENISVVVDTETVTNFSDALMVYDANNTVPSILIRTAAFILLVLFVQILYFRKLSAGSFFGDMLFAVAASYMTGIAAGMQLVWLCAASSALLLFTAFTGLHLEETSNNKDS